MRAIELEENTERLDLMDTERAVSIKALLVPVAKELAEEEAGCFCGLRR